MQGKTLSFLIYEHRVNNGISAKAFAKKCAMMGYSPKNLYMRDLHKAFQVNSVQKAECIPIDWQATKTPNKWKINGEEFAYDWEQSARDNAGVNI